jgi:hypothetical protein
VLHALALDENREDFALVPFTEPAGETRLEQVWFAGSHSDVGGGYASQEAALIALKLRDAGESEAAVGPSDVGRAQRLDGV